MINLIRKTAPTNHFIVKYYLEANTSLKKAAMSLAIGQSIGNPSDRSIRETDEMYINHSCFIIEDNEYLETKKNGIVNISFPLENINLEDDGISQILCHIAGGQVDILEIKKCHILDIQLPDEIEKKFRLKPSFGISGFRRLNNIIEKPFFGGIIKPKLGMSPSILLDVVKEMVYGGVNFIKEDELLGNPNHCPLEKRVPIITKWLKENAPNVIYCFCINSDSPYVFERVKFIEKNGGNGVHINMWSGLGIYRAIRKEYPNMWIHFQKSGDRFFTDKRSPYYIYWPVICKIAGWSGVDSIHAGMIGGYMNQDENELMDALKILWEYDVIPALSCGMHAGLVQSINDKIKSFDWMANVGGSIHGHPMGTKYGALAITQAINGNTDSIEYKLAIEKWGNN